MPGKRIHVAYFDGRSARAQPMQMWVEDGMLQLAGRLLIRQVPLDQVRWSEASRQGVRRADLPDGGSVQGEDPTAWDAWCTAQGLRPSLVVRLQGSWHWAWFAVLALLALGALSYWRGLPLAARWLVHLVPPGMTQQIGQTTLQALDQGPLKPSKLPLAEQQAWATRLQAALSHVPSPTGEPVRPVRVTFRHSRLGPNALALPDGVMVVTDELVELLRDRPDVLIGVAGHEWGHVQRQHGLRALIQASLLSVAVGAMVGDFSTILAGVPTLLGQLSYSRDFEREADEAAVEVLRANQLSPAVMTVLFDRLPGGKDSPQGRDAKGVRPPPSLLGIAFSSHPASKERVAFFLAAARHPPAP